MNLQQAKEIAIAIRHRLEHKTSRLHIAGSIRRQKPEPKDIEIVASPIMINHVALAKELFATQTDLPEKKVPCADWLFTIPKLGTILKGKPDGKYMQILLPEGVNLDLFMPDDFDYYRQFVIRTGSADYVRNNIATGWVKLGWCGSDVGLRKQSDCLGTKGPDGKTKWKCINLDAEKPPFFESEQDFFNWIKVPMIPPNQRF